MCALVLSCLQLQGGFAPLIPGPPGALPPGPPLGAVPPDPSYRLALRARYGLQPPKCKFLATSLVILIALTCTCRLKDWQAGQL